MTSYTVAVACVVPATLTDGIASATVTEPTAAACTVVTVTVVAPVFPPDVALIEAVPAATPVTMPRDGSTVATAVLLELHETVRPVSTLLFASSAVAVACVVAPILTELETSETTTEAIGVTGAVMLIAAWPVALPLLAVMLAVPAEIAEMTPMFETVATLVFDELHVTDPPTIVPLESRSVADAWAVCGTVSEEESTATVTLVTGPIGLAATTVNSFCPITASTFARTTAWPARFEVMTPSSTRAMLVSLTDHAILLPDNTVPREFFTTALAWIGLPMTVLLASSDTTTLDAVLPPRSVSDPSPKPRLFGDEASVHPGASAATKKTRESTIPLSARLCCMLPPAGMKVRRLDWHGSERHSVR